MRVRSGAAVAYVRLDDVKRTWLAAARNGVDEERAIVAREQFVRQMQTANAVVFDRDAVDRLAASVRATSGPKPSSPKKMLPMPATSIRTYSLPTATPIGSTSSG